MYIFLVIAAVLFRESFVKMVHFLAVRGQITVGQFNWVTLLSHSMLALCLQNRRQSKKLDVLNEEGVYP